MSTENSMDGVNTRLMELYACPLSADGTGEPDDTLAMELHKVCEQNYGYAGEKYIRFVVKHLEALKADHERIRQTLRGDSAQLDNPQLDNIAVLALADYYSSMAVFGMDEDAAFSEAIGLGRLILKNIEDNAPKSTVDAAWDFVCGWIASNRSHFCGSDSRYEVSPIYGILEKKRVFVISNELNTALDAAGYSHRKCIKGFQEKGYIDSFPDSNGFQRSQTGKSVKGVLSRTYVLRLNVGTEDDKPPLIDEDEEQPDFLK